MGYNITITNTHKSETYKRQIYISPSTNYNSTVDTFVSDFKKDQESISIPLYKRSGYITIPPNSFITLETDDTDEVTYYQGVQLEGSTVDISGGESGPTTIDLMDYRAWAQWKIQNSKGVLDPQQNSYVASSLVLPIPANAKGYIINAIIDPSGPQFPLAYTTMIFESDIPDGQGKYTLYDDGRKSSETSVGTETTLQSDEVGENRFLAIYFRSTVDMPIDISGYTAEFNITFTTE